MEHLPLDGRPRRHHSGGYRGRRAGDRSADAGRRAGFDGRARRPGRAAFGLWQAGTRTGFGKYNEPGSVTWDEHHSKDFARSTAFYQQLFGWEIEHTSDTDEFRYFQGLVDGQAVAGLMDSASHLPAEVPSH